MKKPILLLLKIASLPLLALLGFSLFQSLFKTISETIGQSIGQPFTEGPSPLPSGSLLPLTLSFFGAILFRFLIGRFVGPKSSSNPFNFLDTLEHELTHGLFGGYLTFAPPSSLKASADSEGEVILKKQNILILLSPYFFPLWTMIALSIGFFIHSDFRPIWNCATLALFGLYIYRLALEFRWYQPDLKEYGRIFSTLGVAIGLLLSTALIFHGTGTLEGNWVLDAGARTIDNLKSIIAYSSEF